MSVGQHEVPLRACFPDRRGMQMLNANPFHKGTTRLATGVCRLRHDRMEHGPTEPRAGRSTFLLSSGGAGGRVLLSGL